MAPTRRGSSFAPGAVKKTDTASAFVTTSATSHLCIVFTFVSSRLCVTFTFTQPERQIILFSW
jgi:hypothetical protein